MKNTPLFGLFLVILGINGCTSEKEPLPDLCENPPTISIVSTSQSTCNLNNGSVNVIGTGGTGTLTYSLDDGPNQTSSAFADLSAGSYTITVEDENGCSTSLQATVNNSDGLNVELTVVGTTCDENQGSILIIASDAVGAVEYKLDEGGFQSSNSFVNLPQGGYAITVRDGSGCEVEQDVDIKTDITFSQVNLIIQTNCAVSGCHDGNQTPDFRDVNNVVGNASLIKQRTGNKTMPAGGGSLTDEQIATIACWVDDGASGN